MRWPCSDIAVAAARLELSPGDLSAGAAWRRRDVHAERMDGDLVVVQEFLSCSHMTIDVPARDLMLLCDFLLQSRCT